jgi:outer membrane protein
MIAALALCFLAVLCARAFSAEPSRGPAEGAGAARMEISVEQAILMALENNRSLMVERYNPDIVRTGEDERRAVFDTVLSAEASASRDKGQRVSTSGNVVEKTTTETEADIALSRFLSTGTEVELDFSVDRLYSDVSPDQHNPRIGLSVTQALLRGRGPEVNLAALRQAGIDTEVSQYELRGFAEGLVAQVEGAYWDYYLAERQMDIFRESMAIAEQQVKETEERIEVGVLAETELAAAQAEVALRREDLINARSELDKTRLRLLRLLSPPGEGLWQRGLRLLDSPEAPALKLESVEAHAAVALRMRPVLNEARLQARRGELEVAKTKNGLLPVLDFFINIGKSGYAESFGEAVEGIDGDFYDASAGLRLQFPLQNRAARALHRRAVLSREQSLRAVENLAELIEMEVRTAYIEASRTRQQIDATAATRELQQEKLRVETEKFRVGRSTMLLVAQAERDFLESQISEAQAVVNHLKALVDLYRLEGSLLERRGISALGAEKADGP